MRCGFAKRRPSSSEGAEAFTIDVASLAAERARQRSQLSSVSGVSCGAGRPLGPPRASADTGPRH